MDTPEAVECPFCFERMEIEDRQGIAWLVCPNGCATEIEAPVTKAADGETDATGHAGASHAGPTQARAAGG